MLPHYNILMNYYLNSRVLGFSVVWIYGMVIIRCQLILLIDVKWLLYATIGSMSIYLHPLVFKNAPAHFHIN